MGRFIVQHIIFSYVQRISEYSVSFANLHYTNLKIIIPRPTTCDFLEKNCAMIWCYLTVLSIGSVPSWFLLSITKRLFWELAALPCVIFFAGSQILYPALGSPSHTFLSVSLIFPIYFYFPISKFSCVLNTLFFFHIPKINSYQKNSQHVYVTFFTQWRVGKKITLRGELVWPMSIIISAIL